MEKPQVSNNLKDTGTDGRIILKQTFKKQHVTVQAGLMQLRIGTSGGH
jgi:hypothetical protein